MLADISRGITEFVVFWPTTRSRLKHLSGMFIEASLHQLQLSQGWQIAFQVPRGDLLLQLHCQLTFTYGSSSMLLAEVITDACWYSSIILVLAGSIKCGHDRSQTKQSSSGYKQAEDCSHCRCRLYCVELNSSPGQTLAFAGAAQASKLQGPDQNFV